MNADVRRLWESEWEEIHRRNAFSREPLEATEELSERYEQLRLPQRRVVDEVLAEWATSDDAPRRYDALSLIRRHEIASAAPALRMALARIATDPSPRTSPLAAQIRSILRLIE